MNLCRCFSLNAPKLQMGNPMDAATTLAPLHR